MALELNDALDSLQLSGIRRITAKAKQTPGCVLLTLGEPDGNTADEVKREVGVSLEANDTHYPPNNGKEGLRNTLSAHMARRGLSYSADEVIVTCGATEALFVALTCVMNPGDEVIVPTPAFGLYESIVTLNRGVFVALDTSKTEFQIDDEALRSVASPRTKAIVITSPNNPTGCAYDEESLAAVARFACEHDVFVICDDVYASLVYDDFPYRGFACRYPDLRDRVIVCDSFSKPYAMTGWRLGWVAADASIAAQMAKIHQYMVSSVPSFVQRAAERALEQDVAPARGVYRERRDYVLRRLDAMGLPCVHPAGAFYAFPSIERFGMPSEEFCLRLIDEEGVALVPGSCFSAEGFVRLSYCCSMESIEAGLDRLERFVLGLEGAQG
ncbi:aminotransferase [Slackia faecicanis]|uniref:Aminotransferase n=1 Tax=Slackia faecicanis TaxID=255723 RepID=A0A3N0ADN1_9ACTN|nr:aminotransferase class I/II-fold pyridoxal phosphate-dependent enzyme [Slackia faecicanis]RNL18695.1 aminotransferase [Slackia faecicanis]